MKTKIICILIITLLIATSLPALGLANIKKENTKPPSLPENGNVDQEQTEHTGYGMVITEPYMMAQSFKPSVEDLKAVQLMLFNYQDPPSGVYITVSIREEKNGSDLTKATINADDVGIVASGTWVMFDFDDITVIPEETYYITCNASDGGFVSDCYCWLFNTNSTYDRGKAWHSSNEGNTWITLWEWSGFDPEWENSDYCFKTYNKISRDKTINSPLQQFLQNHPILIRLLNKLLQRLGL